MPLKEQIPTEHYHVNDKNKAYVLSVEKGLKGAPQVLVNKKPPRCYKETFELEIPEIYEGLIEEKQYQETQVIEPKLLYIQRTQI